MLGNLEGNSEIKATFQKDGSSQIHRSELCDRDLQLIPRDVLAIYANQVMRAATEAMRRVSREIVGQDALSQCRTPLTPLPEFLRLSEGSCSVEPEGDADDDPRRRFAERYAHILGGTA